jgi:hypothetical protein
MEGEDFVQEPDRSSEFPVYLVGYWDEKTNRKEIFYREDGDDLLDWFNIKISKTCTFNKF